MCNLNFLIKTNSKKADPQNNYLNAYNSATFNSFINNSDSEGFYFDDKNTILTSEEKINLFDNEKLFNNSRFVLGHERISTSGFNINYAQPFKKDGFVFVHNGIISDYAKDGHSDTYNLFNIFLKHFERYLKSMTRPTAIKKAVEKILKNKLGSFSIGIFDIKENELFYFKNANTQIHAIQNKSKTTLYLTTNYQNSEFLKVGNSDFEDLEIKDNTLYLIKITSKNKISIKSKGVLNFQIKKVKIEQRVYGGYSDLRDINTNSEEVYNLKSLKQSFKINKSSISFLCEICHQPTYNTKGDYYGVFCDSCLCEMEDLLK